MSLSRTFAKWASNYDSPRSLGSRLRAKRIAPLITMIEATFRENRHVNILDVGGTRKYWSIIPRQLLEENQVSVTILNRSGIDNPADDGPFRFVHGDGCDLSEFADKSFHIAHSNSVLEHVGDWRRMLAFAAELSRVSERYFVQTPNYWFPIEPHCMTLIIHWLPKPMRVWMVLHYQLGYGDRVYNTVDAVRRVESARLLNKRMFHALFPDAEHLTEKFFLLPKSLIAIRR